MNSEDARMLILAGPNGAGKTTFAANLLKNQNQNTPFLNADIEAQSLAPNKPENAAIAAAREVLLRMDGYIETGTSFAIETTLSGRAHLGRIQRAISAGWLVDLHYLWLETEKLAHERVAARVKAGGHTIPQDVISRRFLRGLQLLPIYCREVSRWTLNDNSSRVDEAIAVGSRNASIVLSKDKFIEIQSFSEASWSWLREAS